jgi:glycyl-tRNA synthetase beta chain
MRLKMSDFLFELGIEEVPVTEIEPMLSNLETRLKEKLKDNLVEFKYVETAATNRRFMIYISDINKKANDREEQIKGPAKKIAYDENGNPTLALKKFLDSNKLQLTDLKDIETKKGTYMAVEKKIKGQKTTQILKKILPDILESITFSKGMVWNESRRPFIRPIRNILALFDNQTIKFEFAGVKSSNTTFGHILLSEGKVPVNSFREYCELLTKNFVIVQRDERKKKIIDEITDIEEEFNANIKPDNEMLDYYIFNNEYPVVFQGTFEKKYLMLPSEIISTFMIKEKKLLPVYDKANNLLNIFIGVSNIPDENKFVTRGNERVIQATFEDAKFFWEKDREDDFLGLRESLKNVTFHEGLGTYYQKNERLKLLVEFLCQMTKNEKLADDLRESSLYCKNDLITRMVREFPSLQGIMAGLYLKEKGVNKNIWKAVYGHYEPKGFVKIKLEDLGAGILSMADKIDNIVGLISKGIKTSSSKDPYGIRRDANAIIKIIVDFKLDFNFNNLIQLAVDQFTTDKQKSEDLVKEVQDLFFVRIENSFKDFLRFRYDIVNSTLDSNIQWIYKMYLRCQAISKITQSTSLEDLITLHKRIKNIIKNLQVYAISEDLFKEEAEKILYDIYTESKVRIVNSILENEYMEALSQYLEMKPVIDNFFDKIHIMTEDRKLKENRIALLQELDIMLSKIADFSQIVESS